MRISALLLAGLVVLTLTGCQPDDPIVVPQPEPSSTPLFASEEEALAAAEEAFAAYLVVADQIFADGGTQPERLLAVATEEEYERQLEGFANFSAQGKRSVGASAFDTTTLQFADLSGMAVSSVVTFYTCQDFSSTEVLDSNGNSITSPNRQTRWPVVVTFDSTEDAELVVAEVEPWTGKDYCNSSQ